MAKTTKRQRWDTAVDGLAKEVDALSKLYDEFIGKWAAQFARVTDEFSNVESVRADDFESWRDNLPESLQSGATGEKLDAIMDIDLDCPGSEDVVSHEDLETMGERVEELREIELPQGFGRD